MILINAVLGGLLTNCNPLLNTNDMMKSIIIWTNPNVGLKM